MEYNIYTWDLPNYSLGDWMGEHGNLIFYDMVLRKETHSPLRGVIDVDRVVCRLSVDEKWWIVAYYDYDIEGNPDIGPFDTLEDALVHFKLSCSNIR